MSNVTPGDRRGVPTRIKDISLEQFALLPLTLVPSVSRKENLFFICVEFYCALFSKLVRLQAELAFRGVMHRYKYVFISKLCVVRVSHFLPLLHFIIFFLSVCAW